MSDTTTNDADALKLKARPWEEEFDLSPSSFGLRAVGFMLLYVLATIFIAAGALSLNLPQEHLILVSLLSSILAGAVAVVGILKITPKKFTQWTELQNFNVKNVLWGAVLGLAYFWGVQFLSVAISNVFDLSFQSSDTSVKITQSVGVSLIIGTYIIVPFVAPFIEEVVFRGVLRNLIAVSLQKFPKIMHGVAIVLSSALFAGFHYQGFSNASDILVLGVTFTTGVLASLIVLRYKSIWPAFAFHAAYNLTIVLL